MKKALLTLAAVALAGSAYAQGTISFSNADIPNAAGTGTYNAPVFNVNGTTPLGAGFTVGLFSGETMLTSTTFFGETGLFVGDEAVVPSSAAGSTPSLTVRAWQTSAGSFAAATLRGASAAFTTQPLGGPNPTPPPPAIFTPGLTGLQSFSLVPEPSTYALGIAGLGALAMMRRRK